MKNKVTDFGKFLRKFRIERDEKLYDMAKKLNISIAFLSSVETGKKPVPQKLIDNLKVAYDMSDEMYQEMNDIVSNMKEKDFKINTEEFLKVFHDVYVEIKTDVNFNCPAPSKDEAEIEWIEVKVLFKEALEQYINGRK